MSLRKSINVLNGNATAENGLKAYQPVILSESDKEQRTNAGKTRDLLRLFLSVTYFLLLVFALTILLT